LDESIIDVICSDDARRNCPVKLDGVFCDGYNQDASIGVFSHFHDDHIRSIHSCISKYRVLITHPLTFEGINALKPGLRYREQWIPQDYDTAYKFVNGTVRLLKANHIPGSSQVYVESDDKTLLYSGDFSYPDVQIRQADYLVIDSTHGDPWTDGRTDRNSVKNRMLEYVEEHLKYKPQVVIMVPTGTLQEIVRHFEVGYERKMSDDIAFVMEKAQDTVLRSIYRYERNELRSTVEYDSSEFWDLIRSKKRCVIFSTQLDVLDSELRGFHKIIIDRHRFAKGEPTMIPFDGGCRFNLAAHASIDGIYQYVESVNPKYVITDNSRSGYAKQLAKLIEQKFPQIKTEYRPPYA